MPTPGPAPRGGPRLSHLLVAACCVLAVLLFGSPPGRSADPPAPVAAPAAPDQRRLSVAAASAAVLDPDGVQRRRAGSAVALTFDDGPDPRWTPTVLAVLRQHGVRATFCVVGRHVAAHPDLVRRIADEGHALCNHSWAHDEALGLRSAPAIRADLGRTNDAIVAATGGLAPSYLRAPAGRWTPALVRESGRLGLRPLGWSVDPRDWRRPPAARIVQQVLAELAPGGIVLLHDGYGDRSATVAALRQLLPALTARRVTFGTP